MTGSTDITRNACYGYVSELTFALNKDAFAHFEQKRREAAPKHLDVYDYLFHRVEHVRGTMQTECTIRRDAFLRRQRHDGADMKTAVEAWDALCWEFTR